MKFKIGDRVRAVKPYDDNKRIVGKIGTIIAFDYNSHIGVKFDEYIGGHSCASNGKNGYCWWCSAENLEPITDNKIVITTDGITTTAKLYANKKIVKSAKTKCSPEDKFDFETGAEIAFDRLLHTKKTLHLMHDGDDYGKVGKPTDPKDISGEQLYIGDEVNKNENS